MKISKIECKLTGDNLLSIINEFLNVEGLNIESINIDNNIRIQGSFNKKVNISFYGELEIQGVKENKIYGRFSKFKAMNLGFFRMFRSIGLKMFMKYIPIEGIEVYKDNIIIDIKKILLGVPYVDINISDIFIKKNELIVEVSDAEISIMGTIIKKAEVEEAEVVEEEINFDVKKVDDLYSSNREEINKKLPEGIKGISDYLFIIPDIMALVYRLLKDSRVSIKTKLIISASVAYVAVPNDIIPKKVPLIGKIDDLAIVFFALNRIVNDVPLEIILENWAGENELVLVLKNGLEYIVNFTGAKNIEKLCKMVEQLKTL